MNQEKLCKLCKTVKNISEFYSDKSRRGGLEYRCKECSKRLSCEWDMLNKPKADARKKRWLARAKKIGPKLRQKRNYDVSKKYSLSASQMDSMLIDQCGLCACCSIQMRSVNEPHIDHDHSCCDSKKSCGKCVRGLLCASCNHMLGNAKDSIETLQNAINYLKKYR